MGRPPDAARGGAAVAPTATGEEEVMIRYRLTTVVVTATLMCLAPLAAAQEEGPTPLTWVRMMQVKPGADLLFEKAFDTYEKPLCDQLVADGTAISWALGYELAGPGGYNYVFWINAPDWASIGKIETAFDTLWEGRSEEDLAQMIADWTEALEPGGDQTQLLQHTVFKANPDADWKYLRLTAVTVKPGHGDDVVKMWKSFWAPVYDQLLESGVIAGYGMVEQAIHSDSSFTHESWITFNDLANLDQFEKAFETAYEQISAGEGVARKAAFMKMLQSEAHFDRLIRLWKKSE
jgi:hypothetical protein